MADSKTTDLGDWNPGAGHPGEVQITDAMMAAGMGQLADWVVDDHATLPRLWTDESRHMLADAFRAMWITKQEEDALNV
jgi:hypothetical protein